MLKDGLGTVLASAADVPEGIHALGKYGHAATEMQQFLQHLKL